MVGWLFVGGGGSRGESREGREEELTENVSNVREVSDGWMV